MRPLKPNPVRIRITPRVTALPLKARSSQSGHSWAPEGQKPSIGGLRVAEAPKSRNSLSQTAFRFAVIPNASPQ